MKFTKGKGKAINTSDFPQMDEFPTLGPNGEVEKKVVSKSNTATIGNFVSGA